MRVLVDSSIWSLALRRSEATRSPEVSELKRLISSHQVEIVGPIRQEVLSGVKEESQFDRLEAHLAAFSDAPLSSDDFVTAAKFFNVCRAKGVQGSNTDFLICAIAVRHDFAIFTTDCDFHLFAKYLPITLHESSRRAEHRTAGGRR